MLGYLSVDIIYSEKLSSRKTVSFEVQIMFKDNPLSIFSHQMEAILFIILQIFFAKCAVLKIGEYPRIFTSLRCLCWSCDVLRPMACKQKHLMHYKLRYPHLWSLAYHMIRAIELEKISNELHILMKYPYPLQNGYWNLQGIDG